MNTVLDDMDIYSPRSEHTSTTTRGRARKGIPFWSSIRPALGSWYDGVVECLSGSIRKVSDVCYGPPSAWGVVWTDRCLRKRLSVNSSDPEIDVDGPSCLSTLWLDETSTLPERWQVILIVTTNEKALMMMIMNYIIIIIIKLIMMIMRFITSEAIIIRLFFRENLKHNKISEHINLIKFVFLKTNYILVNLYKYTAHDL